ncbi:histidine N-acetyltransferase-like [Argopecten irradians]|uniref:histidine N-acetyltransferase-like n=1 Tax=Argopecten irradians TaxID=31199 RepID=UPI00371EF6B7
MCVTSDLTYICYTNVLKKQRTFVESVRGTSFIEKLYDIYYGHQRRMPAKSAMDLTFRQVTADDYDDVIAIRRGIYYGLDYLAGRYHTMLKTHRGYVAMDGEKMVGFAFLTTVDDGTTSLVRAARVHEDYEGKGVYRSLSDYIRQFIICDKNIKRSAIAMHVDEEVERLVEKGATFVGKRKVLVFQGAASTVLPKITDVMDTEPLNHDAIAKIFTSTKLCSILFPTERFVCNWVAYRLLSSNIQHFVSENQNILCTSLDPENASGQPLLSIGMPFKCAIGDLVCVDFHGDIGERSKVKEHLEKHMKMLLSQQAENIVIMVTFDDLMDDSLLKTAMTNLSMKEKNLGINMNMIEESV